MTGRLTVLRAGPAMTLQDLGRPGHVAHGLSRGGALDPRALLEAQALLGAPRPLPAIEMGGMGGTFSVTRPVRIALTGAQMDARLGTAALEWNASHLLRPDEVLTIGGVREGTYGYLTLAGALDGPQFLDSRAAHLSAGLGERLTGGTELPYDYDPDPGAASQRLVPDPWFSGGEIRAMPGPQTALFAPEEVTRFLSTSFTRNLNANRQGVAFDHDGPPFAAREAAGLASDFIVAGDIQMTGAGVPVVLLAECQTIGGYPRIATVIAEDLPRLAQTPAGATVTFRMLTCEEADALHLPEAQVLAGIRRRLAPRVRDPHDIPDLLGYQLIGGVTTGTAETGDNEG